MNIKCIASALGAISVLLIATSAQASVDWSIVGTAPGQPDLIGTVTTPNIPVDCVFMPPTECPISGTLAIPPGTLGGPGTAIDLATDPSNVIVDFANSPPSAGDTFSLFGVSKDGYTCNASSANVLECSFGISPIETAQFEIVVKFPSVVIGNGNVVISGELHIAGEKSVPCRVDDCSAGVTTLTCGLTQVEIACAVEPVIYSIGDTGPAGGIVFYITAGGLHGLEAAPTDQSAAQWGCGLGAAVFNARRTLVGYGKANTQEILNECLTRPIAASVADDYMGPDGSTTGWYLPSKDELALMYLNKSLIGDFGTNYYFSSSEWDNDKAWAQLFSNGTPMQLFKIDVSKVRAIRAF